MAAPILSARLSPANRLPADAALLAPAAALWGSATMAKLLGLLSLHPVRRFAVTELRWRLGASLESTQRAVQRAVDSGLVSRERDGRRMVYGAAAGSAMMPLRHLALRVAILGPRLVAARTELGPSAVEEAFVFGSMARGDETPHSDVDLLVVGGSSLWDLDPFLRDVEDVYDRRFDIVLVSRDRFDGALAEGQSFYRAAVAGPRIPVLP
jgi:uncharacterized protein